MKKQLCDRLVEVFRQDTNARHQDEGKRVINEFSVGKVELDETGCTSSNSTIDALLRSC